MNSGNGNLNIRFWRAVRNLTTSRTMSCIVLIMQQLQCLQHREVNIACTRFVQRFLRFSHSQTAQNNSQKLRLKKYNISYTYNPAFSGLCKESWDMKDVFIKKSLQNDVFSILIAIFAKEL